jgi:hypothetical protein
VRVCQKFKEHNAIELAKNPSILKELGDPDEQSEYILKEAGLETEYEPAAAVHSAASLQYGNHPDFRAKIEYIDEGYQKSTRCVM